MAEKCVSCNEPLEYGICFNYNCKENERLLRESKELEQALGDDEARVKSAAVMCAVCNSVWVDVMEGEDTCPDCCSKQ